MSIVHHFLVLPEDHSCYDDWRKLKGLSPTEAIRVSSTRHMRGYAADNITIVLLCDWQKNLSNVGFNEILQEIQMYEALGTRVVRDRCYE